MANLAHLPPTNQTKRRIRVLTDRQIDKICLRYAAGEGSPSLAKRFGVTHHAITRWLCIRRVPTRRHDTCHPRKYHHKEQFFASIDSEAKAYWLGFIWADGSNFRDEQLQIALARRDRGHLVKLKADLESNHPISNRSGQKATNGRSYPSSRLRISSPETVRHLRTLGIVPRKTYSNTPIPAINPALLRHFWRGVIDGDGCISKLDRRPTLQLCGTEATCQAFSEWAASILCREAWKIKPDKSIWCVAITRFQDVRSILAVLYEGATRYLERKKMRAEAVLKMPLPTERPLFCTQAGCTKPNHYRGLCGHHLNIARRQEKGLPIRVISVCMVVGCKERVHYRLAGQVGKGYCRPHSRENVS